MTATNTQSSRLQVLFLYALHMQMLPIPVTGPLLQPSPAGEQQIPVALLFGQGVEAVTHYDTAVMSSP